MDGKRTRCLQIVSLHVPIYLLPFLRHSEIFVKKLVILSYPLAFDAPVRAFSSEYRHPLWDGKTRMASLPDGEKISKISLFVLTWSTNVTDRQTDRHCMTAKTALASHRAVKMHHSACVRINCIWRSGQISKIRAASDRHTQLKQYYLAPKSWVLGSNNVFYYNGSKPLRRTTITEQQGLPRAFSC